MLDKKFIAEHRGVTFKKGAALSAREKRKI
jgi:hypothetical protein